MSKRTEISNLGEFGLISHLAENVKITNESSVLGIGDDAAIIDNTNKQTVVTTDLLLEGIHFDLTYTPLKHLGYKAVVVNISDIIAMNATPHQITVSIGVSKRFSVEHIDELYEGINAACEVYIVDLVGGDTSSSLTGLTISVTAIGDVEKGKYIKRSTANEGDLICVTGDLGAAYMGLQLLAREKEIYKNNPELQPDLQGYDYILERQLKPEAQIKLKQFLEDKDIVPTAMIDISDGLSSEMLHICSSSKVGCKLFFEKIPLHPETEAMAKELNIDAHTAALNGGEDYDVLFTIKSEDYDKIKDATKVTVIGHIASKDAGCMLIANNNDPIQLQAQGWQALMGE